MTLILSSKQLFDVFKTNHIQHSFGFEVTSHLGMCKNMFSDKLSNFHAKDVHKRLIPGGTLKKK